MHQPASTDPTTGHWSIDGQFFDLCRLGLRISCGQDFSMVSNHRRLPIDGASLHQRGVVWLIDSHCKDSVSTTLGSFVWALLWVMWEVVPGSFQIKYTHWQVKDLPCKFNPKCTHKTRLNMLGPIKTYLNFSRAKFRTS